VGKIATPGVCDAAARCAILPTLYHLADHDHDDRCDRVGTARTNRIMR
jgi:hypothetical protein